MVGQPRKDHGKDNEQALARYAECFKIGSHFYQQRVIGTAGKEIQRNPNYQGNRKTAERA
jgi:hypothetical protein